MRKMKAAAAETTKKVDDATQAGTLIDRSSVATFPKTLDKVTNLTPNIDELDDLAKLEADTIATLPAKITPSELLKRRRGLDESVDAAYRAEERHGQIRGTKDKGKKELAGNMRGELRKVADIAESDDLARRQMLVAKMWQDIGERSKTVPMSAALAGAGAASLGIPGAGPIGASMAIGRTWPQIPMAIGSVPVRATGAAINPELLRAALIAHLTGQQE
jgi:hypothetical protein